VVTQKFPSIKNKKMVINKKIIILIELIILLLFFVFKSLAQQKTETIYFNMYHQSCDSEYAESIKTIIYIDTLTNRAKEIVKSNKGVLKSEIEFSDVENRVMNGSNIFFYENGRIKKSAKYKNGKIVGNFKTYYPDGTLKRIEKYSNGILKKGKCFTQKGEDTSFYKYEVMPSFPGSLDSLNKFISENIQYDESLFNQGIFGKVVILFIINSEGFVSNAIVKQSVSPIIDNEALRVIKLLPKWSPGFQDGQAIPTIFSIPINFEH